MGTRADFYIGRGEKAEWIGSIAWDGYREGLPDELFSVLTEADWRKAVTEFVQNRKDGTLPKQGWPWPWEDSNTTDCAYAFHEGKAIKLKTDGKEVFPNMKAIQNVTFGKRSGTITITPQGIDESP